MGIPIPVRRRLLSIVNRGPGVGDPKSQDINSYGADYMTWDGLDLNWLTRKYFAKVVLLVYSCIYMRLKLFTMERCKSIHRINALFWVLSTPYFMYVFVLQCKQFAPSHMLALCLMLSVLHTTLNKSYFILYWSANFNTLSRFSVGK